MKRPLWLTLPIVVLVTVLGFNAGQRLASAHLLKEGLPLVIETQEAGGPASGQIATPLPGTTEEQITQALQGALEVQSQQKSSEMLAFMMYDAAIDQIFMAPDGGSALLWLALVDPATGEKLETEPGIAVAQLNDFSASGAKNAAGWDILFPSDPDFMEAVDGLPPEVITEPARELLETAAVMAEEKAVTEVYGGYKLPWAAGLAKRLTQSVDHVRTSCTLAPTCVNAYDFADGTMFPLLAAKGGTVKDYRVTCSNGDTACTNFILLEDRSTDPVTYQVYYHMAKETIPAELRVIGTTVLQGQYIGNVDDTGASTGHHLHFHVYKSYNQRVFFQNIVPITFDDVRINVNPATGGGQPRMCWEASAYPQYGTECSSATDLKDKFVSGNTGAYPPTGNLSLPAAGYVLDQPVLRVEGTASDDQAVTRAHLIVRNGATWIEVGEPLAIKDGKVSGDVDMCSGGAPSGVIEIALRLWDKEGNQTTTFPGRRAITNNNRCEAEASLLSPTPLQSIEDGQFSVSIQATSPVGLASVRVLARQNGAWSYITAQPAGGSSYTASLNACSLGFTTGPLTLTLEVTDKKGVVMEGLPGLRTVSFNYTCPSPPPVCQPSASQVAVFAGPNYTGACKLLNRGSYSGAAGLYPLGDNDIESVLVGSSAYLTLYEGANQTGRSESFEKSDPNLADNILRGNLASSLVAESMPSNYWDTTWFPKPGTPKPVSPSVALGRTVTSADSVILTWAEGAGSSQFSGRLHRVEDGTDTSKDKVMSWRADNAFPVGNLRPGSYTWWVMGSKRLGSDYERRSATTTITFTVGTGTQTGGTPVAAPFSDDLNSNTGRWAASGRWRFSATLPDGRAGWAFNNGTDYSGVVTSGDLTSPPIQLPAGSSHLTFTYLFKTEANGRFWDRRVLQISVDGGEFSDLLQLTEDPTGTWLTSQAVDLTPFAGKIVRLRFHFDALDGFENAGLTGWLIDSLQVKAGAPPVPCGESKPDNQFASAVPLAVGASLKGAICPGGDVDIYRLTPASSGLLGISVQTDASSALDPYLSIYNGAGQLLLEVDDLVPGEYRDSFASLYARAGETYYLRVRAWNHPSAGGASYTYTISAAAGTGGTPVRLIDPQAVPVDSSVVVKASAAEGLVLVKAYWHNQDWEKGTWELIGVDSNGADGWSIATTSLPAGQVGGLYVEAVNAAGARWVDVLADYHIAGLRFQTFLPNVRR